MKPILVFKDGEWVEAPDDATEERVRFRDIWRYRGNFVDYFRIVLCFAAAFAIVLGCPGWAAALVLASILLDWVDGPVARAYGEITMLGSGIDWLADVQASVLLLVWSAMLAPWLLPWIFLATTIELACAIFDFAITATGRYPVLGPKSGFSVILEWSLPRGVYSRFGTFLWLAYPLWLVAVCLDASWPLQSSLTRVVLDATEWLLAVPAVLYVWCELAYLVFVLDAWSEPKRPTR